MRTWLSRLLLVSSAQALRAWAWTAAILSIAIAQANASELIVTSPVDGSQPYLVSFDDENGNPPTRPPGIYNADSFGKWHKILSGNPISGKNIRGILAQLPISQVDRRFESVTVLNGRIIVFHSESTESDPETFIEFGSERNPVVDPITDESVKLPPIELVEAINLRTADVGQGGELLIFSIRLKEASPIGDGITFAAFLQTASPNNPRKLETLGPTLVLDYKFQTQEQLRALSFNNSSVVSRQLVRQLARPRKNDTQVLRNWRAQLSSLLNKLDENQNVAGSLPRHDFQTGQLELPNWPMFSAAAGAIHAVQALDPLGGNDGIIFSNRPIASIDRENLKFTVRGRFSEASASASGQILFKSPSTAPAIALAYINRELHYMQDLPNQGVKHFRLQEATQSLPSDLSIAMASGVGPNDAGMIYLLTSKRFVSETPKTELFVIRIRELGFEIVKHLDLMSQFIPSDQLQLRLSVTKTAVLFDDITPLQESAGAYHQTMRPTLPYLDLTNTASMSHPKQSYVMPLKEIALPFGMAYREYDTKGARENLSGLYVPYPKLNIEQRLGGALLNRDPLQPDKYELASRKLTVTFDSDQKFEAKVSVVALDQSHTGGKSGFTVYAVIKHESGKLGDVTTFDPMVASIPVPMPFTNLEVVQVLQGRFKNSKSITFLLGFSSTKDSDPAKNIDGGIAKFTGELRLDPSTKTPSFVATSNLSWVHRGDVSVDELRSRIVFDDEGSYYWVATPEIAPTALHHKLLNLANSQEFFPNTSGAKGRKILTGKKGDGGRAGNRHSGSDSSYDEDMDWGGMVSFKAASWRVYNMNRDFEQKHPNYFQSNPWRQGDGKIKASEQLIGFEDLGSTMNRLSDPGRPAQQIVFILPDHDKAAFVQDLVGSYQADLPGWKWADRNFDLKFSAFNFGNSSQTEFSDNFDSIKSGLKRDNRALVLVDASDLIAADRPESGKAGQDPFVIDILPDPSQPEQKTQVKPSALYLMAAEGEFIQPDQLKGRAAWERKASTVIVATKDEWAKLVSDLMPGEREAVTARFQVDHRFFRGTWKLQPPSSPKTSKAVRELEKKPVTPFERKMFGGLTKLLNELADPDAPAKHRVLLLPGELLDTIHRLILGTWANPASKTSRWSASNPEFQLYHLPKGVGLFQEDVFQNMEALIGLKASKRRGALVAPLSVLKQRPAIPDGHSNGFYVHTFNNAQAGPGDLNATVQTRSNLMPHLLYLLENEGRRTALTDFEAQKDPQHEIPMLFFGTQEEWQSIRGDLLTLEDRFGLSNRLEVVEFPIPDVDTRVDFLQQLTTRPEVETFQYQWDATRILNSNGKALSQAESRYAVLRYIVTKCESLAREKRQEVITSFIAFASTFSNMLLEDDDLRKSRVINLQFVENLFPKVFPMPLNLRTLPKTDPLIKLSSPQAVLDFQNAGYEGPLDLKAKIIETELLQAKFNPVKPIPASFIVYGDTSTGKTHLFKTLVKWMGLPTFDFNNPNYNRGIQAFIVYGGRLVGSKAKNNSEAEKSPATTGESIPVQVMFEHLYKLLAAPGGERTFILFDDVHKMSDDVRAEVLQFWLSLLEAQDGLYHLPGGKTIPVRNLNLWMTLNPTDDQEKRKRFHRDGSPVEIVLATLATPALQLERSTFERVTLLMDLSQFPQSAKGPKLRDTAREAARDPFNNAGHFTVVSPRAIQRISNEFPNENARAFLSRAVPPLVSRFQQLSDSRSQLSIVVPTDGSNQGLFSRHSSAWEMSGSSGSGIESFIQKNTVAVPIDDRIDGKIELLRMILDTFRTTSLESLVTQLNQDPRVALNPMLQAAILSPMLHALVGHVTMHPELPLNLLAIDPRALGLTSPSQREELKQLLNSEAARNKEPYFPVSFADELPSSSTLQEMTNPHFRPSRERGRAQVLATASKDIQRALTTFLASMLRVKDFTQLPDARSWLSSIQPQDPDEAFRNLGKTLVELYLQLSKTLNERGLIETSEGHAFPEVHPYDASRLFLLALDKAISRLPWTQALQFLQTGLSAATDDMSIGQLVGTQHYLFTSKLSLVRPVTHDLLLQMASNSQSFKDWSTELVQRFVDAFPSKCPMLFDRGKSGRTPAGPEGQ